MSGAEEEAGYNRYYWFISDWAKAMIEPVLHKNVAVQDIPTESRQLFDDLFRGFTYINDAIQNLGLCIEFLKARAPRRKGLDLSKYLGYHVSFYLQENYVLKERLELYAKRIARVKRKRGDKEAEKRFKALDTLVNTSFKGLAELRGKHVHVAPFVDEKIDLLSTAHTLSTVEPDTFEVHVQATFREARSFWIKTMRDNRESISQLMDQYCDFLYQEMTSGNEVLPGFSATYIARRKIPGVSFKSSVWGVQ